MKKEMNWLEIQAAANPDGLALRGGDERLTFAELKARVDLLTGRCTSLGITSGTHVALLLPASVMYIELIHALIATGAVIVPLNMRLTEGELTGQIIDSDSNVLITTDKSIQLDGLPETVHRVSVGQICSDCALGDRLSSDRVSGGRPSSQRDSDNRISSSNVGEEGGLKERESDQRISDPGISAAAASDMDKTLALIYTSGTSGRPKGVELSYSNFFYSALGTMIRLEITANDSWLLSLPLYHIGGFAIPVRTTIYGIPVILPGSLSAEDIGMTIRDADPTIISLVPTMIKRIIDSGVEPNPSHRAVLLGGGPVDTDMVRTWRKAGWKIALTYGSTETCSQVATLHPDDTRSVMSAGKPLPFNRIRITDENRETVSADKTGFIEVQSPSVMKGYYKQPADAQKVIRDGWYHTGDFGHIDEEGYLHVESRRSDLIVSGGENIDPLEVEKILSGHPAIRDVCVFPSPDPEWGQIVAAACVAVPDTVSVNEIKEFLSGKLADYKIPKKIIFVDSLPYSEHGKINRQIVASMTEK